LRFINGHRDEHVLIMLADGPGFAESFTGVLHHDTVPPPVSPLLIAHNLAAGARRQS
jgi:hypothetical protein